MRHSYDLVCLSHLRWNFVFQRPQHLLSRAARDHRVFFVEEPIFDGGPARIEESLVEGGVVVVVPHLPEGMGPDQVEAAQGQLLGGLLRKHAIDRYVLWYYTPMALGFTGHLEPLAVLYDCMDELSGFHGAPPRLVERERQLFGRADLVFTGGHSLYEHKRDHHHDIHPFPSSVDVPHFAAARTLHGDPDDQRAIPHPRIGFYGVVDERMDLELVAGIAEARPEQQLVLLGPVCKIDPASLPRRSNIHWLGGKGYADLPSYLARWDVAFMPFAHNSATRFISPTKTPEFLAAGLPVVSTSIRDVVRPYGELGLCRIADTVDDFVAALDASLDHDRDAHLAAADRFLADLSWDRTFGEMQELLDRAVRRATVGRSASALASPGRAAGASSASDARLSREAE